MANIPLITGLGSPATPLDPSNTQYYENQTLGLINQYAPGVLATISTPFTTTGTGANNALSVVLPANYVAPGTIIHLKAEGVNSADVNAKTVTLAFGAFSQAFTATGSGVVWLVDAYVVVTGAATESGYIVGQVGTTFTAPVALTNGTVAINAPITVNAQLTAATSGTMTANIMFLEILR